MASRAVPKELWSESKACIFFCCYIASVMKSTIKLRDVLYVFECRIILTLIGYSLILREGFCHICLELSAFK